MGKIYDYKMKIPFDMSDVRGRIKIPQLILLSLQVSEMQSLAVGLSDKDLLTRHNLVWIVTDYAMDINRLPEFGEEIRIETEALTYNRLFCYRRFSIFDEKGTNLVEMLASFVLMDRDSRRVQAVDEDLIGVYESTFDKKVIRGPKYPELDQPASQTYQVRFYDLDMNGHVNNSKYLEWVFEAMGIDFLTEHIPQKINLKYVKEVRSGGEITSSMELQENTSYHQITSSEGLHAQAKIEWKKG